MKPLLQSVHSVAETQSAQAELQATQFPSALAYKPLPHLVAQVPLLFTSGDTHEVHPLAVQVLQPVAQSEQTEWLLKEPAGHSDKQLVDMRAKPVEHDWQFLGPSVHDEQLASHDEHA